MNIRQRNNPLTHSVLQRDRVGEGTKINILSNIYFTRGILSEKELDYDLKNLLPYTDLKGIQAAVECLYEAITTQKHIMIIGDFDADGATSTALAVRALRAFGAKTVSYLVPNRFEYGYGLTPEIVAVAAESSPDVIMTVDNGVSSIEGVDAAKKLGIKVVITDHHLVGDALPAADAIVNPNQPGDHFASKMLAGVGVCFYLMLALRAYLREKNWFEAQQLDNPNMAKWLDIVALGTVADVVPLDYNNRILVSQGLRRINARQCVPGILALLEISKKNVSMIHASTLAFSVAPRLNAAGRLDDMSVGIECLLTDEPMKAQLLAQQLHDLNQERRDIEEGMKLQAFKNLNQLDLNEKTMSLGLCIYDPTWHQGVIGILAARVKEKYHRPVIAFAKTEDGTLKGSGRSIEGVHIRDVLDSVAKRHPNLIEKFGGHAMAAGLSLLEKDFEDFSSAFNKALSAVISEDLLHKELVTDGELLDEDFSVRTAELLNEGGPWGQGFPEPLFDGVFEIVDQRLVGERHLKLSLRRPEGKRVINAIAFNIDTKVWPNHHCNQVKIVYRLDINEYQALKNIQLLVEYIEVVS